MSFSAIEHPTASQAVTHVLAAAECGDVPLTQYELPNVRGAEDEPLAMYVATFGDPEAQHTFVLVGSGHGPEDFCYVEPLATLLSQRDHVASLLGRHTRLVIVFNPNPYGLSHYCRTTEENLDCNRNFGVAPPREEGLPPYLSAIDPHLNPGDYDDLRDCYRIACLLLASRQVTEAFERGQQCDPQRMFYIGREPGWTARTITEQVLAPLETTRGTALVASLHSGIGTNPLTSGHLTGFARLEPSSTDFATMCRLLDFPLTSSLTENGHTNANVGTIDDAVDAAFPRAQRKFTLTLEAGVEPRPQLRGISRVQMFLALWWRHNAERYGTERERHRARRRMLHTFYPRHRLWRDAVTKATLTFVTTAIRRLADEPR